MTPTVVVTPNPAIDVTYDVAAARLGSTNRVRKVHKRAGGKGLNVARVLETLGHTTTSVLPLGGAAGDWIDRALRGDGLAAVVSATTHETRTTVTISEPGRHPTVFAESGAALLADEWLRLTSAVAEALSTANATVTAQDRPDPLARWGAPARSSMLVVSGSFPPETDLAVVGDWIASAAALSIPSLVDSSGDALIAAARAGADIVKPNADELRDATGASTVEEGMRVLLNLGARLVVVSRGADGLVAADGERTWRSPAVAGVTGNPTGAGDAATAGLVAALTRGMPIDVALTWAAAAGAAAVLRPTAGEIELSDFTSFVDGS
ncbi:MAG TPA: PfkB family carbohydrate kinase, partial [Pseudolysinimonas sp.]|nr:PfkB family carbohydrate kinase [Pseudolysinimonas sp.]